MNTELKPRIRMKIDLDNWDIILDGSSPKTGSQILNLLPIESDVRTWGEEIYFSIPLSMPDENAKNTVALRDVAYWPQGQCFCVFFGKTPLTTTLDEIKPASPVNVFGKVLGDLERLKSIKSGVKVTLKPI
ncbi:MAG: cyclophilin-like fold protein [Candidatus Thorarchaeota archaeon]